MEAHLTGASSDKLLEGLSFSPPSNTASYVTETKFSNFFAESGNTFDSLSSKVIRFRVADQGFLESASLRLRFTITNLKSEALTPCASPMSMFRRARLFAASQLVEDLTLLPNQTTLRDRMLPMERRVNNSIEANPMDNSEAYMEIGSQASRRVIAPLPFGTVNQPSWIPMHLISGGMVIELELDEKNAAFAEATANWILQDVSLLATIHTIDSSLANSYASHVLQGNPLHLHYTSVVSSRHIVPGASFTINLVRGFTRLRQIFWTYHNSTSKESRDFIGPGNTTFAHANDGYSWMVTIGSRKFPERNSEGVSEAFMRFRQAAAVFYGQDAMSISAPSYMKNTPGASFIQGLDLEKTGSQGSTHSGISTKDGSIVQLAVNNSPLTNGGTVLIHLVYDGLLSIRDGSCDVFE